MFLLTEPYFYHIDTPHMTTMTKYPIFYQILKFFLAVLVCSLTACGVINGNALPDEVDVGFEDEVDSDDTTAIPVDDVITEEDSVTVIETNDLGATNQNQAEDISDDAESDLESGTPSGPVAFPVTWPKEGDDCIPDDVEVMAVSYDNGDQTTFFFMPNDGKNHRFLLNGDMTTLVCEYVGDEDGYIWLPEDYFEGDFIVTIKNRMEMTGKKKMKITVDIF